MRRLRGQGATLEQELVDAHETDDIAGGAVLDGLDVTAHHEHRTLNRLDEEVDLLAWDVVGTLDADLGAGTEAIGEETRPEA